MILRWMAAGLTEAERGFRRVRDIRGWLNSAWRLHRTANA